jgi:ribosomal protein S25
MNKKDTKQNEVKNQENANPPAPVAEEQVEALTKEVLHWKQVTSMSLQKEHMIRTSDSTGMRELQFPVSSMRC